MSAANLDARRSDTSRANRRYVARSLVALALYVALSFGLSALFRENPPSGWLRWALAAAPAVPVVGLFLAVGLYLMEEKDEFARMVLARALLIASGVTMAAFTVWDSLVAYGVTGPARPFVFVTVFFVAFGLGKPLVRLGYR